MNGFTMSKIVDKMLNILQYVPILDVEVDAYLVLLSYIDMAWLDSQSMLM